MIKYKSIWQSKTFWAVLGVIFVAVWNAAATHFGLFTFPNEIYAALAALGGWGIRSADSTILLPGQAAPARPDNVVPTPAADPTPVSLPAPEAAPTPGDPAMSTLISLLTAALSLGAAAPTPAQVSVLDGWTDTWLPKFKADVLALGDGITPAEVLTIVGDVVPAANELKKTFEGADRAEVVGVTVRFVVQEFAPPALLPILAPILASGVLEGVIEAKYRELFPEAPVVNAPELPSGAAVTQ